MPKTSAVQPGSLEHFVQVMSRVLGVPEDKLGKMVSRGLEPKGAPMPVMPKRGDEAMKLALK